ncbi:MAG: hypothetical protein LBS64_01520 [Spirochaetaceae bacterium]|jgi:hypothetical protein|nr:hypothetical protein [Spirochaetaceae bacterium]
MRIKRLIRGKGFTFCRGRRGIPIPAALILTSLLSGCASLGYRADFFRQHTPLTGDFIIRRVEVLVDHGADGDLAWEVEEYAGVRARKNVDFTLGGTRDTPSFGVDISLVQRSYIHKLAIRTSIYGTLTVRNQVGEPLLIQTCCFMGNKTLVSAAVQKRVVDVLFGKALSRQRKDFSRWKQEQLDRTNRETE